MRKNMCFETIIHYWLCVWHAVVCNSSIPWHLLPYSSPHHPISSRCCLLQEASWSPAQTKNQGLYFFLWCFLVDLETYQPLKMAFCGVTKPWHNDTSPCPSHGCRTVNNEPQCMETVLGNRLSGIYPVGFDLLLIAKCSECCTVSSNFLWHLVSLKDLSKTRGNTFSVNLC